MENKYIPLIRITALFGILIGLLVTIGRAIDSDVFQHVIYGFNTMKFNTALCVILLSTSILLAIGKKQRNILISKILCGLVIFIAGLTFLEDLFAFNAGIDELIFTDTPTLKPGFTSPGRMAIITSISLVFMAVSMLLVNSKSYLTRIIIQYLLHSVTLISFITIIGYIYQVPDLYKLSVLASMAIHTAVLFFLLSIAISLLNPYVGLTNLFTGNTLGSIMSKRLLPAVILIMLVLGYIRLISHEQHWVSVELGIALFTVSCVIVCLVLIINTARHLDRIDARRSAAEHSFKMLNRNLEETVRERTKNLEESEGKFHKIFMMSPTGLVMSDSETGSFVDINQAFTDLTGYTAAEIVGKKSTDIKMVSEADRTRHVELIKRQGYVKNSETIYHTKSGEERNALMSIEIIDVGSQRIFLTVLYDITELKQTEQKLIEAKLLAEASSVAKERFMANMSHEIRTPMNAIIGFTNLMEKDSLNEDQSQYLRFIKSSGENLLVLINDILDYSKIEAGMMEIEKIPFNIADLLHSIEVMFSERAREKKLELRVDVTPDVPEVLIGDPTRLTQILINLLGNALKFTSEGTIHVMVSPVSLTATHSSIRIVVKDTGIGIPESKQQEIFDRFTQASTETTRNYGGTGLGLSIVKSLVKLQNGELTVSSKEHEGTEFQIVLPYEMGESIQEKVPVAAVVSEARIKQFSRELNVLLAEDNIINQTLAKKVLTRFGCQVDIAENGGIAVEMARSKSYDIILMDIQMPIMDGYTASRELRSEYNIDIPIIAMTAHVMAGEKEKCMSFGMNDYISKPFNFDALYELIAKYTGG